MSSLLMSYERKASDIQHSEGHARRCKKRRRRTRTILGDVTMLWAWLGNLHRPCERLGSRAEYIQWLGKNVGWDYCPTMRYSYP
jgi:hypothetical protein